MSSSVKKENIFSNINFISFWQDMTEAVKGAVERFWEKDISINLFAINDYKNARDEYFVKNSNFFSCRIRVDKHKPVIIRLDNDFVNNFLNDALESKNSIQELKNLTELEIKILNSFCEYLYRQFQELLISPKQAVLSAKSEKNINIIFNVSSKEDTIAKIMISVPQDRINMVKLDYQEAFSDNDFINSAAFVKIRAGYVKLRLEELKNLAKDDIVVLDNSDISKLTLISGDVEKDFKVEAEESLRLDIGSDDNEDESGYEVKMEKNLWDDIQIELSAEFSKVKMTIGELKQITKGQIVDLGSVFNNEISLFVENKKVAKGELLIINDKYAVRLNEVLSSNMTNKANVPEEKGEKPKKQPEVKKSEGQPAQDTAKPNEDEEFDYSDFEN